MLAGVAGGWADVKATVIAPTKASPAPVASTASTRGGVAQAISTPRRYMTAPRAPLVTTTRPVKVVTWR